MRQGGASLAPPVVKSQICEPSAVRRRTPNWSPPSRSEGGEFSHKKSIHCIFMRELVPPFAKRRGRVLA